MSLTRLWPCLALLAVVACAPAQAPVAAARAAAVPSNCAGELDVGHYWSLEGKAQLRAHLTNFGMGVDSAKAERILGRLDDVARTAASLQQANSHTCAGLQQLSPDAADKVRVCLRTGLIRLRALTLALSPPQGDDRYLIDDALANVADDLKACPREAAFSSFDEAASDADAERARTYLAKAGALRDLGRFDEAEQEATKAGAEVARLRYPRLRIDAWLMQAEVALDVTRAAKAEELSRRAVADATLAKYWLGAARGWDALRRLAVSQERFDDAVAFAQKVLALREQELGAADPETALALRDLGEAYAAQGDFAKALDDSQRAYTTLEQTWGAQHPQTLRAMLSVAKLYERRDDGKQATREALDWYLKALGSCRDTLGDRHPLTADAAYGAGLAARNIGDDALAFSNFKFALQQRSDMFGGDAAPAVEVRDSMKQLCLIGHGPACLLLGLPPPEASCCHNNE